jgi:DNA-binding ferritin-like protein (Dps family)
MFLSTLAVVSIIDLATGIFKFIKFAYEKITKYTSGIKSTLSSIEDLYKEEYKTSDLNAAKPSVNDEKLECEDHFESNDYLNQEIEHLHSEVESINKNVVRLDLAQINRLAIVDSRIKLVELLGSSNVYDNFLSNLSIHASTLQSQIAIIKAMKAMRSEYETKFCEIEKYLNLISMTKTEQFKFIPQNSGNATADDAITDCLISVKDTSRLIKYEIKRCKQKLKEDIKTCDNIIKNNLLSNQILELISKNVLPTLKSYKSELDKLGRTFIPEIDKILELE